MEPDWQSRDCNDPSQRRQELVQAMHRGLHDLCQPLTALLCLLEIGRMADEPSGMREAIDDGMVETRRIFAIVARMRSGLSVEEPVTRQGAMPTCLLSRITQKEN